MPPHTRFCGRRRWWWRSARWKKDRPRSRRRRRRRTMPDLHETIVRPVVTEKSSAAYGARKEYAFRVHNDATKPQIKAAIETLFKVSVTGVRNNKGHITSRYMSGGHKRQYRRIDFRRNKFAIPARVAAIEYDPNRTARIALLHYSDGEKRYILAPKGLNVGDHVVSGPGSDIRIGNAMPLFEIPLGTAVHNVELKIGRGGQLCGSAGTRVQVVAKEGHYVTLRLRSTEMRMVRGECLATIGEVGFAEHELLSIGKAGKSRWLGRSPRA